MKRNFFFDSEKRMFVPSIALHYVPPSTRPSTSPVRTANEGPAIVNGGSSPASAAPGSPAAGGAAGIGNLLPWLYPTSDFLNLDKFGGAALNVSGATIIVLQFQVPRGRNGKITQLGIDFSPNGNPAYDNTLIGPAALCTFSLFTDQKGYRFQDYEAFTFLPGSVSAPTPINGLMIKENQVVTLTVVNNNVPTNPISRVAARLLGYTYSKSNEPKILGYQ